MKLVASFILGLFTGIAFLFYLDLFQSESLNEPMELTETQDLLPVKKTNDKSFLTQLQEINEINTLEENFKEATSASIDVMSLINLERKKKSITQVSTNNALLCAAQFHARDIGSRKACSHYGKDGSNFVSRAKRCGLIMKAGGEIVACGQSSPKTAVNAWIASPGHNQIMFNRTYTSFGCDMYNNYWVCVFSK